MPNPNPKRYSFDIPVEGSEQILVLDADQRAEVEKAKATEHGGWLNASKVSSGKTIMSATFCAERGDRIVLVSAPLATVDGWRKGFEQANFPYPFRQIDSTRKGKEALEAWRWGEPGAYFVGPAMLTSLSRVRKPKVHRDGTPHLDAKGKPKIENVPTHVWSETFCDTAIIDEGHDFLGDATYKAISTVSAGFRIWMGATPWGDNFDNAYLMVKWTWPHIAEKDLKEFRSRWALTKFSPFTYDHIETVGEKVPGAFISALPCVTRLEPVITAPTGEEVKVFEREFWVDLSPEQRRIYTDLEEKAVVWLQGHPLVSKIPANRRERQRQVTLAVPTLVPFINKDDEQDFEVTFPLDAQSTKIDCLMDDVLSGWFNDEPALIFSGGSQKIIPLVVARLNERYGAGSAAEWSGANKSVREENMRKFIAGEIKYLVAQTASLGAGFDGAQLATRNLVYLAEHDRKLLGGQSRGRVVRRGTQSRYVRIAQIMARDTWDADVMSGHLKHQIEQNKQLALKSKRR